MANEPVVGSYVICAVKPSLNGDNQLVPVKLVADDSFIPPRLLVELPDRALRDLGVITVDGNVTTTPATAWSYHEDSANALTDEQVAGAPGVGLSLYVTDIVVSIGTSTAMNVFLEEGATKILGPYYIEGVAGRGITLQFHTAKKITANTPLTITTSSAIAHGIDVTGYIA